MQEGDGKHYVDEFDTVTCVWCGATFSEELNYIPTTTHAWADVIVAHRPDCRWITLQKAYQSRKPGNITA